MKLAIIAIPVAGLLTVIGLGCANGNDKKPSATGPSASALDVAPPGPNAGAATGGTALTSTPAYTPTYTPPPAAPAGPVVADASPAAPPADPGAATGANKSAGRTYTIQKGDTLFRIAKDQYGDGRKWQQIAAANPGLNANAIKVGQKIVLP